MSYDFSYLLNGRGGQQQENSGGKGDQDRAKRPHLAVISYEVEMPLASSFAVPWLRRYERVSWRPEAVPH